MEVTALDEAGKKAPHMAAGATTDKTTGYEYVYYDSSVDQQKTPVILTSRNRPTY